jgi:hypothetical protein
MNRLLVVLAVLTFGLIFVGMFWWLRPTPAAEKEGKLLTHMHCPDCFLELPFSKGMENRSCPHCGPSGPKMIATAGPRATAEKARPGPGVVGSALAAATIALVLVQACLYGMILLTRSRRHARESQQAEPLVCRCPFCSRKIGYPPQKVGSPTVCARCKTVFELPAMEVVKDR